MTNHHHTPAPWFVDPRSPDNVLDALPDDERGDDMGALLIADCAHTENAYSNALLIAHAPEMLETLQAIVNAAELIAERWESGDLAEAVNNLDYLAGTARSVMYRATGTCTRCWSENPGDDPECMTCNGTGKVIA